MKKIYALLGGMLLLPAVSFAAGEAKNYPGFLNVEMGGEKIADNQPSSITITPTGEGICNFLLPNLTIDLGGAPLPLGDIALENVSLAVTTFAPASSSINSIISQFSSLSSTKRTCIPAMSSRIYCSSSADRESLSTDCIISTYRMSLSANRIVLSTDRIPSSTNRIFSSTNRVPSSADRRPS